MNNYKLHEAFSENGEILGFWMAKFQANIENGVDIDIKPGKALTLLTSSQAENIISSFNKKYSLMSDKEREAVLFLSMSNSIEISNDLVHYAGGAPNEDGFKTNTRYSSTGNIYGVYDLITSEIEITSGFNDEGRFRETIR